MLLSRLSTAAFMTVGLTVLSGAASAQVQIGYDPNAGSGNFGNPGPDSNQVAYTINLSEDATNLYGTITVDPQAGGVYDLSLLFANLYFGTGASAMNGSDLGIEVTNNDAFYPGGSSIVSLAGTGFSFTENALTGTISFTLPWSFLETDPLGIGFDTVSAANPDVILRLSQSFGYSVAGGATFGDDRLGLEALPSPVPEPGALGAFAVGCLGLGLARSRLRNRRT